MNVEESKGIETHQAKPKYTGEFVALKKLKSLIVRAEYMVQ